jgi:hypothetical protein
MWAASSGWEGPFQHEEVIVLAPDRDGARVAAEAAFTAAAQPICRAKMWIADLGPAEAGATTPPRRSGELLAHGGEPVELRCAPPVTGADG